MHLKKIELFGFKSFADRTVLEFEPGVTAVVGPNGSGKSNVSDGIRWVLGEQSAKSLRGAKMEDVIFVGSDSRKALNYGEVTLTLDNTCSTLPIDFSEVTVTRRVYRSGESEYYLNRQACRLRDITELFMDTGLGKDAYSIIGQGRIEEILSTKSEERRGIFEDAAGIVKYKVRKREAQKKLDDTEANLVRILDIIEEIDEQMTPLEEQAKTAQKFRDFKDDLKGKEIGLYVYNIDQTHQKWQVGKERVKALSDEQLKIASEVNRRDALIEQKRWQLNQLDQELEQAQQKLLENVQQNEKLEGQREVLRERDRHTQENHNSLLSQIEHLQEREKQLHAELEKEISERVRLKTEMASFQEKLNAEEKKWKSINQRLESDLEQLKADYIDLLGEIAATRNERKNVEHQQSLHTVRLTRLQADIEGLVTAIQEYEEKIRAEENKLKSVQAEIEAALHNFQSEANKEATLKLEQDQLIQDMRNKEQIRNQLGSRLEVLKEMQTDFTGFNQGVKEVLKVRKSHLRGIHGAVAELITVPQKFEVAIEIALGGNLQHVVVEDEESGRQAIQYLKEQNLGRATFLPISVMKERRLTSHDEQLIQRENGVLGIASQLISFKDVYQGVIGNLLGTVIIAESLHDANRIARTTGHRYRIVTLDGDVVNPGGSMTGGTIRQRNNNLLGRGRVIEEIESELQQVDQTLKELYAQQREYEQKSIKIQEKLDEIKAVGEKLRSQEQEIKRELTRYQTEYKNIQNHSHHLDQEKVGIKQEGDQFTEQLNDILTRLTQLEKEEAELKIAIDLADQSKKEQETSREEMSVIITELKVSIAEQKQRLDHQESVIARLQEEIKAAQREKESEEQDLQQILAHFKSNEDLEQNLMNQIEACKKENSAINAEITEKRGIRTTIYQEMDEIEENTKEFRKNLRQVEEQLHKEEVRVNRAEVELDNLLDKLREEYELTYEAAKLNYPAPPDEQIDDIRKEVFRLKRDIVGLGDVNLGAIEEYERISERYQFLTDQSEDLLTAKQSLYQIIEEMEEEMTKRFVDTFAQIRVQFQRVFTQLFGGGRADLVLTDDDILETGIEIVAQPPGKKLQNLALLSGGEKALTAIALLFAILRVRPVPFCVLDEVEAALDEANVARFADYLKEFSSETQFIVITHRKGTMEGADALYGVTMAGSGISKLVSVRLEDLEEEDAGIA